MPKAPRDQDNTAPKKRVRKSAAKNGNGVHADAGNMAAGQAVTAPAQVASQHQSPGLEEKIRMRAYELYLERGGHGGSPEQDWLRAKEEVCGQQRSA